MLSRSRPTSRLPWLRHTVAALVAVTALAACNPGDDTALVAGESVTLEFAGSATTLNMSLEELLNASVLHTYVFDADGAYLAVDGINIQLASADESTDVVVLSPTPAGPGHHITPVPLDDVAASDTWILDVTVAVDAQTELAASTPIRFDTDT